MVSTIVIKTAPITQKKKNPNTITWNVLHKLPGQ